MTHISLEVGRNLTNAISGIRVAGWVPPAGLAAPRKPVTHAKPKRQKPIRPRSLAATDFLSRAGILMLRIAGRL